MLLAKREQIRTYPCAERDQSRTNSSRGAFGPDKSPSSPAESGALLCRQLPTLRNL
jgi:hypothetical protein